MTRSATLPQRVSHNSNLFARYESEKIITCLQKKSLDTHKKEHDFGQNWGHGPFFVHNHVVVSTYGYMSMI